MRNPLCRLARPRVLLLATIALAIALAVARTAGAYHTQFVATYCNYDPPPQVDIYTRQTAASIALIGASEGYQWAGGCWNSNNIDDSPGDPPSDPNTGG